MTPQDKIAFAKANRCFIYYSPVPNGGTNKLRDEEHLTARFRGGAKNACNLNYKYTFKVPVMIAT